MSQNRLKKFSCAEKPLIYLYKIKLLSQDINRLLSYKNFKNEKGGNLADSSSFLFWRGLSIRRRYTRFSANFCRKWSSVQTLPSRSRTIAVADGISEVKDLMILSSSPDSTRSFTKLTSLSADTPLAFILSWVVVRRTSLPVSSENSAVIVHFQTEPLTFSMDVSMSTRGGDFTQAKTRMKFSRFPQSRPVGRIAFNAPCAENKSFFSISVPLSNFGLSIQANNRLGLIKTLP